MVRPLKACLQWKNQCSNVFFFHKLIEELGHMFKFNIGMKRGDKRFQLFKKEKKMREKNSIRPHRPSPLTDTKYQKYFNYFVVCSTL